MTAARSVTMQYIHCFQDIVVTQEQHATVLAEFAAFRKQTDAELSSIKVRAPARALVAPVCGSISIAKAQWWGGDCVFSSYSSQL